MARVNNLLGKGGTGRTTVARALALRSAEHQATMLLHADPNTQAPEARVNNLGVQVLDPHAIIEDAMSHLLPLGPLTRALVRHPAYESFLEIAPGIKEAAVLNFVYGLLSRREDHVILDGPATGHGLHFLEAPAKLEEVLAGKVAARMANIHAMLQDPTQTQVVLVALPEELPTIEACDLAATLREQGFPLARLVVNRVPPPVPFDSTAPPGQVPVPTREKSWGIDPEDALALLKAERQEAEGWLSRLQGLDMPTELVPSLPGRQDLACEVATFLSPPGGDHP